MDAMLDAAWRTAATGADDWRIAAPSSILSIDPFGSETLSKAKALSLLHTESTSGHDKERAEPDPDAIHPAKLALHESDDLEPTKEADSPPTKESKPQAG